MNTNLSNDQISHSNNNTSEVIYEEIQDIKPDDYHLTTCPAYGISSKKWLNLTFIYSVFKYLEYFTFIHLISWEGEQSKFEEISL